MSSIAAMVMSIKNNKRARQSAFKKLDKNLSKAFYKNDTSDNKWWPLNNDAVHGTMCGSMAVSSGIKLYGTSPGIPCVSLHIDLSGVSIKNALKKILMSTKK